MYTVKPRLSKVIVGRGHTDKLKPRFIDFLFIELLQMCTNIQFFIRNMCIPTFL